MMTLTRGRTPFALIALACALLLAFAYYAQYGMGLEPCPLCILQRLGFMLMGAAALIAVLHGPKAWGRWIYGAVILIGGGWGITTASRHLWLQSLPADQVPDCGPGLYFMLEYDFPLMEILREAFTGAGECAEVSWSFLGLSMPGWTLIWYLGFSVFIVWALIVGNSASRSQAK